MQWPFASAACQPAPVSPCGMRKRSWRYQPCRIYWWRTRSTVSHQNRGYALATSGTLSTDRCPEPIRPGSASQPDAIKSGAPQARFRPCPPTEGPGSAGLRRYRRRWKVGRLSAWLQDGRRIVTRHERHIESFPAFLQPATRMILAGKHLRDGFRKKETPATKRCRGFL